jgi:hypothetical protein
MIQYTVFVYLLFFFGISDSIQAWELKLDKDQVQVYTQPISGSPIHEFKGITRASVPLEKVFTQITKAEEYPKWMHNCTEGKVLKKVSDSERITFVITRPPWPLELRETIIHSSVKREGKSRILIQLWAEPNFLPLDNERIRIQEFKGSYQLTEQDGSTEVIYQAILNPGGNLPERIINQKVVIDTPYYSLKNLKKLLESENSK